MRKCGGAAGGSSEEHRSNTGDVGMLAAMYVAQLKPAPGIRWSSSSLRPSFVHFVAHIDGTALSWACGLDCAPP